MKSCGLMLSLLGSDHRVPSSILESDMKDYSILLTNFLTCGSVWSWCIKHIFVSYECLKLLFTDPPPISPNDENLIKQTWNFAASEHLVF